MYIRFYRILHFTMLIFIASCNLLSAQTIHNAVNKQSVKNKLTSIDTFPKFNANNPIHLDEVMVTAQKRTELLQKVPMCITVFSGNEVEQFKLWKNKDISGIVPNLYSADPGDDRSITSIRGITSTSYDPTVATYIDGVNQFNLDTYIPVLFDVDRIEVLRGPQGTLYGRNAMGGVINIITKQPTNDVAGFAELSFGNFNQSRFAFGLKTPVVKNKLFVGASFLYQGRDGYYTNDFNNRSYDRQHSFSGNYFLKYLLNEKWHIDLNIKHFGGKNDGPFPLTVGLEDAFATPFKLNQNAITKMHDNTLNTSLAIHYKGRVDFSSVSSFQQNYRYYSTPIDGDFSPIDAIAVENNYGREWNNIKAYTQEFKISAPASASNKLKWVVGTYLFNQNAPVKQATKFGIDANLLMMGDSLFALLSTQQSVKKGFALYGQITYPINQNLTITVGLRNDFEHQQQSVTGFYQHDPSPDYFISFPDTAAAISYSAFSPKITFDYTFNNGAVLYASYSKGYRTGGLSPLSSDPSQPPLVGYKPEFSNNLEVGYKQQLLQNKLSINLAAFYARIYNAQVPTLILPDAVTVTTNTGKLNSTGIEAEVKAIPLKGLLIQYAAGLTDAKYAKLELSQQNQSNDLSEKRPVFTPYYNSSLTIQYAHNSRNKNIGTYIRSTLKNIGNTYFDLHNTLLQTPYALLNVSLGLTVKKSTIEIWSKNTLNNKYIAYAYDFGAVHLGDPLLFGLTLTAKF